MIETGFPECGFYEMKVQAKSLGKEIRPDEVLAEGKGNEEMG